MRRLKIIILALFLAVIGAILPLIGSLYVSWLSALRVERNQLIGYTQRVISRVDITINQGRTALNYLHSLKGIQPCSDEHINIMRKVTLFNRAVDKIAYFENDLLKCSIWGLAKQKIPQFKIHINGLNNEALSISAKSMLNQNSSLVALIKPPYDAYINPLRFTDIIVNSNIQFAILLANGTLATHLHNPDPKLVQRIYDNKKKEIIDQNLVYQFKRNNIIVIAIEPLSVVQEKFRKIALGILPFGFLSAIFIVGLVVYYSQKRLSFLGALIFAVKNREFIVYYQPIIELKTKRCIGAEALVRWRHPNGKIIPPNLFIPQAEESGLIQEITDQIIDLVIFDLSELLIRDPSLHISINASPSDIESGRILRSMDSKLVKSGISKKQIWIEVTERVFLEVAAARKTIDEARALGHLILLDDFGTGYSSLSYLQKFTLDILKIDKSFIDTIGTDSVTSSVTAHIIDMAKELNLKIVAEGVESKEQLDYLEKRGVAYVQGYFFSKPICADDFKFFVQKNIKDHLAKC